MIDQERVRARRTHLLNTARCRSCRMTRGECDAAQLAAGDVPGQNCCYDCSHPVEVAALDELLAEVADGAVRSVEEVDPPPVQGPARVTPHWLLHQREWWQPKRGPMLRVAEMTDTHRLHTARMLQRQAPAIAFYEHQRQAVWLDHPWGPSGDMARNAFESELDTMLADPLGWLNGTELLRGLAADLPRPPGEKPRKHNRRAWADLEARAEHWSTCPRNRNLADPCRCRVENEVPTEGPAPDPALFDEASGRGVW